MGLQGHVCLVYMHDTILFLTFLQKKQFLVEIRILEKEVDFHKHTIAADGSKLIQQKSKPF